MRIILNDSLQPYFNLAAEEYLLENADEDVFMLWRNSPSVIIGKNQNAWAEIDRAFTEQHGIKVVRRLTGGGAVFHDPGNVNFTFITAAPEEPKIDFAAFTEPIIAALGTLGIAAELGGRNDILADGCKISGNAQCVHRREDGARMLLHHGTLLYDADMSTLAGALRVDAEKLKSKGIKSVSSRVRNIRDIGGLKMTAAEFAEYLLSAAEERFGSTAENFTESEIESIAALAKSKYSAWDWNFGKSPEMEEVRRRRFPWGSLEISYSLHRGIICKCTVMGDFFGTEDVSALEDALEKCRFEPCAVRDAVVQAKVESIIAGAAADDIVALFFE